MDGWRSVFLGIRELPREISGFELQVFFLQPSRAGRDRGAQDCSASARSGVKHRVFLRMSGRLLDVFRVAPLALWRHLGGQLGIEAPQLASARDVQARPDVVRRLGS